MQREKIVVAGHDACRLAADGQFQEFVVFRITAGNDPFRYFDELRGLNECGQESLSIFAGNTAIKLLPTEHFIQFLGYRQGQQNVSDLMGFTEGFGRMGISDQDRADQNEVSKTKRSLLLIEERCQKLGSETMRTCPVADLLHDRIQRFSSAANLTQPDAEQSFKFFAVFFGKRIEGFSCFSVHADAYDFSLHGSIFQ